MKTVTLLDLLGTIKRRIVWIALVTVFAGGLVVAQGFLQTTQVVTSTSSYTAEATLYMSGYDSSEVEDYNYVFDNGLLFNNVRRIIISDSVAGEVRREFAVQDKAVTIAAPYWFDEELATRTASNFIFVDATAADPQVALAAADSAAQKALAIIQATLPVADAELYEQAVLKPGGNTKAGNPGVESLATPQVADEPAAAAPFAYSLDGKNLLIAVFLGLFGSAFCFCVYELLNRRIRTEHDVETLTGIPLVARIPQTDTFESAPAQRALIQLASMLQVLFVEQHTLVSIVGLESPGKSDALASSLAHVFESTGLKATVFTARADNASNLRQLETELETKRTEHDIVLVDGGSLAGEPTVCSACSATTGVVVVTQFGRASNKDIKAAVRQLQVAETPVIGMVVLGK